MTSSGKDWCGPLHPITNLTAHTNMPFLFTPPLSFNMHTWIHAHTHNSHTHIVFLYPCVCSNRAAQQFEPDWKREGFIQHRVSVKRKDMEGCDALTYSMRCKIKAVEKCMGIWDQCWGHYVMCRTVTSSRWVFENKANGIPASVPFPLEKSGHGEKQGEGIWILFGWETKRQTKEDEADSLWRRLLYCKIGAASASLSK